VPETRSRRDTANHHASYDDSAGAEGVIGKVVDRACDNPAMTGGLFVMALTASAIVSNALFLQNVHHPEPLFATRPPLIVDRSPPPTPPLPPERNEQEVQTVISPPLPRPAPVVSVVSTAPSASSVGQSLVRAVQTALAEEGYYLGAIDGEYGPMSRAAIMAYEKAEGLGVTGEPSQVLLDHLTSARTETPRAAASSPPQSNAPALPQVNETVAASERLRYERVQAALNRIGYGPVTVNGSANEETTSAIRRFELDNGLPISGAPGDAVVDRLIAIGALPAT
jgi:peptidoglycan hydrolase-like protein with peptidoglycan-binding domain